MAYWLFSKKNSMKNLEIIILAAGKGTRMKSSKPKIFHDLGGKQIIDYVIDASFRLKPKRIHLVVNKQIKDNFKNYNNLNIVIQKKQNGTGDAIKSAIKSLEKDSVTLVLYGDVPLIKHKSILNVSKIKTNTVNLLCFNKEERNNYGKVILGTDGLISQVIEQKELKKNENYYLCNSGIFAIETKLLSSLLPKLNNNNKKKEFYLTDIFNLAFKKGVKVNPIQTAETEVMGVNDKNDLAMAEKEIQNELRSKHLTAGVTMRDPDTVYLSKDTKIGKEVSVGPYARIRPGTKINDNAKIGNFVEIKNSKIDKGSKVNHLSYIGDTEIGKKVNVGAGTITCNYDGASKFKTVIKDKAFIGSNSSLVAPLIVGKNAYIGSGSTITKHVVENSLAVERSSQKMVKNWSNKKGKR